MGKVIKSTEYRENTHKYLLEQITQGVELYDGTDEPEDVDTNQEADIQVEENEEAFESMYSEADERVERATRESDIIVRTAQSEAEELMREAQEKCDEVREAAYQEGYDAGRQAATQEMEQVKAQVEETIESVIKCAADTVDSLIARLENDIDSFHEYRDKWAVDTEPEILGLVLEISEKVIRKEIETDHRVVSRIIKSCLRRVKDSSEVYVHVNPSELEDVRKERDELMSVVEGVRAINILDDRRVPEGGCIVESASGDFDARIETQLDKIRKKLQETMDIERSRSGEQSCEIPESAEPTGHGEN